MAKSFRRSDYVLNKYSDGIVYRFANQTVVVTKEDYLSENPDKTEQDFIELKALSDEMFLEQDRAENAQTKKNHSIHDMEETQDFGGIPLDEQYIEIQDKNYAAQAITSLLSSGMLTDVQKRRFELFLFKGMSARAIAIQENVSNVAVSKSINLAIEKTKEFFHKQG